MKKKIVIAIVLVLLLPVIAYLVLFGYGTYLIESVKMQQRAIDRKMESLKENDNGFGGESGLKVVDSKFYAVKYFWIGNDLLAFNVRDVSHKPIKVTPYIWNTSTGNIAEVNKAGGLMCYRDGFVYFGEFVGGVYVKGNRKIDVYQSLLISKEGVWKLDNVRKIKDSLILPSDRYELAWTAKCEPWFRLLRNARTQEDVPEHRFDYFHEWGWILRTPSLGQEGKQHIPEMGIFDIDKAIYSGQPGVKIADLPPIHDSEINDIQIQYLEYLDKFWLAVYSAEQPEINKSMFLVNRKGEYQEILWLIKGWKKYNELPLLSRKGLVWEGYDYRLAKPSVYDLAGFINQDGVHKFVHGHVETMKLSPDGCKVAFSSRFRIDKGPAPSLKVFNICESTINGKELNDVHY